MLYELTKTHPEVRLITFDFSEFGGVASDVSVTATALFGFTGDASIILSEPFSIVNAVVSQLIGPGYPGTGILITCTATVGGEIRKKFYRLVELTNFGTAFVWPPQSGLLELLGDLPDGVVGAYYEHTLAILGGTLPYNFDSVISGVAPTWMQFDAQGVVLVCYGTPDESAGTIYNFTPQVEDDLGLLASSPQEVNITRITLAGDMPDDVVGFESSGTYTASLGTPPYSNFRLLSGTLPPGAVLNTDGTYTYNYTTEGVYNFTIAADDANGITGTLPDTVTVTGIAGFITTAQVETAGVSGATGGNLVVQSANTINYNPTNMDDQWIRYSYMYQDTSGNHAMPAIRLQLFNGPGQTGGITFDTLWRGDSSLQVALDDALILAGLGSYSGTITQESWEPIPGSYQGFYTPNTIEVGTSSMANRSIYQIVLPGSNSNAYTCIIEYPASLPVGATRLLDRPGYYQASGLIYKMNWAYPP